MEKQSPHDVRPAEEKHPAEDRRRAKINAPALTLHAWLALMVVILVTTVALIVYLGS
jgi:hypothetical protein